MPTKRKAASSKPGQLSADEVEVEYCGKRLRVTPEGASHEASSAGNSEIAKDM